MNEFDLQRELTDQWLERGAIVDGESLLLVAWEVMSDWRINDAGKHWNLPSIDFVFLDRAGKLVFLELKNTITTPKACWSALCQVVHRAHALMEGLALGRLEEAWLACQSGDHGRAVVRDTTGTLVDAHSVFFQVEAGQPLPAEPPVRCAVAARQFGPAWKAILARFNSQWWTDPTALANSLANEYDLESRGNLELRRFRDLAPLPELLASPIVDLRV